MLTRNQVFDTLAKTLRGIVDDGGMPAQKSVISEVYQMETSTKAYEDYQEYSGPPYIGEKDEGEGMTVLEMLRGYGTRIQMRTYAAEITATEETIDDCQYGDVIRCARYLKEAADNTRELDGAMTFGRAFNTDYVMGDHQPLCSATHTLPDGRTWSNVMATPEAPSYRALNIARASVRLFPTHSGIRSGLRLTKIVHPPEQDNAWDAILLSTLAPYAGNFNEINVIREKDSSLRHVSMLQLVNTSTNWFGMTNNSVGIKWFTRKALRSGTEIDERRGRLTYWIKERRGRGPVDARCVYGCNS